MVSVGNLPEIMVTMLCDRFLWLLIVEIREKVALTICYPEMCNYLS